KPIPPLNLVGDYGGGALYLAFGILAAIFERSRSGKGQVVDAAMVDGASSLMSIFFGMMASGAWNTKERAANILDGGTPFYDTYQTSDGQWVSIGSLEPKFFAEMVERIGLDPSYVKRQHDKTCWPQMRADMVAKIGAKTRDEWSKLLEGTDVCFAPVLRLDEVASHPHAQARNAYLDLGGVLQPAPAPRFSRSQPAMPTAPVAAGAHTSAVLSAAGFSADEIAALRASGAAMGD
ncbi:CaiB/BaiF CoA-transferase family protein, partial [Pseudorhodoferax sp.]|uniref:CaiB/BaiF CoA-transferase family protein n=1 Tax=Pseudorhodoferax sp. TaxID=1993553 RepID=UPI002DD6A465